MRISNLYAVTALVCVLAACGGGSGSGGDFGTGVEIDKATLSFSAFTNEPPPAAQTVTATISATDAATLGVGYANGNDQVAWLHPSLPTVVHSPATITFNVDPLVSPGTYTAHPSIAIRRSDNTFIAVRTMTVTYQVTAQPPSVSPTTVAMQETFNNGAPIRHLVTIKGTGTWTATVDYGPSGSGWLTNSGASTFPQSGTAGTFLELYPVQTTPVGSYAATLHIAVGGQTFDVAVALNVT